MDELRKAQIQALAAQQMGPPTTSSHPTNETPPQAQPHYANGPQSPGPPMSALQRLGVTAARGALPYAGGMATGVPAAFASGGNLAAIGAGVLPGVMAGEGAAHTLGLPDAIEGGQLALGLDGEFDRGDEN